MTTLWAWVRSLTAAGYAWQVHGWIWAAVAFVFMFLAAPAAVTFILTSREMAKPEEAQDPIAFFTRRDRVMWTIWVLTMIAIGVAGARVNAV